MNSSLPLHAIWLDAAGIGAMLGYEPRVIVEKIASRPDFPKPARIGNKGRPRWRADEVAAWMEQWRAANPAVSPPMPCPVRSTSPTRP